MNSYDWMLQVTWVNQSDYIISAREGLPSFSSLNFFMKLTSGKSILQKFWLYCFSTDITLRFRPSGHDLTVFRQNIEPTLLSSCVCHSKCDKVIGTRERESRRRRKIIAPPLLLLFLVAVRISASSRKDIIIRRWAKKRHLVTKIQIK